MTIEIVATRESTAACLWDLLQPGKLFKKTKSLQHNLNKCYENKMEEQQQKHTIYLVTELHERCGDGSTTWLLTSHKLSNGNISGKISLHQKLFPRAVLEQQSPTGEA